MGEIADYYIDRMLGDGDGRSHVYGPPLKCNRCGSPDVYWQKVHNRKTEYALNDIETLAAHVCPNTNTTEGFDEVL